MSSVELQAFNDSFERCMEDDKFLKRFYRIFLDSSEEVREKFANTNMERQTHMMLISLSRMMSAHNRPEALSKIAASHCSSKYNISPHLYEFWLDSLVAAAVETDSQFSAESEAGWRMVMRTGINYIVSVHPE